MTAPHVHHTGHARPAVRSATADEIPALARLIAVAFAAVPVHRWLVPDQAEHTALFPHWFALQLERAIAHGHADTVEGLNAVALWLPDHVPELDPEALHEVCGRHTPRFRSFLHTLATGTAVDPPHAELAVLATAPTHQHTGLGSLLLDHGHRRVDLDGGATTLLATDPTTRAFYRRRGYTDHGAPLTPAPGAEKLFPMLRPPAVPQRSERRAEPQRGAGRSSWSG